MSLIWDSRYSKTFVKRPLPKIGLQDQLSLNTGKKYCRMEDSEKLSTFIKVHVPFVIKIFILFILKWPLYTVFTVQVSCNEVHIIVSLTGPDSLACTWKLINYFT